MNRLAPIERHESLSSGCTFRVFDPALVDSTAGNIEEFGAEFPGPKRVPKRGRTVPIGPDCVIADRSRGGRAR